MGGSKNPFHVVVVMNICVTILAAVSLYMAHIFPVLPDLARQISVRIIETHCSLTKSCPPPVPTSTPKYRSLKKQEFLKWKLVKNKFYAWLYNLELFANKIAR